MSITHEENQAIIDAMYARGVSSYLDGTPEEIAAVERHRKASPYKIGHEPDYKARIPRLPRKKKKLVKKWIKKYNVKFTLAPPFALARNEDQRLTRGVLYSAYRMMNSYFHNQAKEIFIDE